jgi:hypothetical protein
MTVTEEQRVELVRRIFNESKEVGLSITFESSEEIARDIISKISERPDGFSGTEAQWIRFDIDMAFTLFLFNNVGVPFSEVEKKIVEVYDETMSLLAAGMSHEEIRDKHDREYLRQTMQDKLEENDGL